MNVRIQSVKFDADKKLLDFVETKVSKLERFAERNTGAEVTLKIDKDHERGNKVAVLRLEMPGNDLVAEHRSSTFEEAVDSAVESIKKQIEKYKVKIK